MIEYLATFGFRPVDGINALILLVVIWILVRVVNDEGNSIVWADFVSSYNQLDKKQHGDLDKVGQLVGILVAAMCVLMYADNTTVDAIGLAGLLAVSLAYLGGVRAYAAWLRSKQNPPASTTVTQSSSETKVEVTK